MPRRTALCGHPIHPPTSSDIVPGRRKRHSSACAPDGPSKCRGRGGYLQPQLLFRSPALAGEPVIHVPADLVLGQTVTLLNLALELVAASVDDVEVIVGELAPLFLDLAFDLLPVPFYAIPIHYLFSSVVI